MNAGMPESGFLYPSICTKGEQRSTPTLFMTRKMAKNESTMLGEAMA
jgi:hypothetical protein